MESPRATPRRCRRSLERIEPKSELAKPVERGAQPRRLLLCHQPVDFMRVDDRAADGRSKRRTHPAIRLVIGATGHCPPGFDGFVLPVFEPEDRADFEMCLICPVLVGS